MATPYLTNQFPDVENQDKGNMLIVTCILDEGGFTFNDVNTVIGADTLMNVAPAYTFTTAASQLSQNDYIEFKVDTGVTYAATFGKPVVTAVASTDGVYGKIISKPVATTALNQLSATADADSLAERLAGKYYRIAQVAIFASAAERKLTNGSTILVGSDLLYDVSSGTWALGGGSNHGCVSAHYSTTASEYVLGFHDLQVVPSQA